MSLDHACRVRKGRLVEPRSNCGASLDEHPYVRNAETSERASRADDVKVEESDSDGSSSSVCGCAGWVHRCPCKYQVEGDCVAANEHHCKLKSPV